MQGCFADFIQKGVLEIKKEEKTKLIIKSETANFDNELDSELFEILKSLSNDNIIDKKHICMIDNNMSNRIVQWYIKASQYGNILWQQKKSEERHKDVEIVRGLEKFLLEYSNIKEKSSEEVIIWEEYLTFSVIFGIANNVVEELREVIPDEWFMRIVVKSREMILKNYITAMIP